ncbi:hypothetical protein [Mucilaginibacter psychrotolerans]|uniref:Uncharacterized protein n=1 Tax=Mucilaginibacter psychrotolerans TaxID=1524096 RepID=A0A4Y8S4T7_9SPHI|nr:hypothetical protein [Mucilaginibacter psychrotolerans]TFF33580.1 hypothetical protein E2R66_25225 [Mucilaginibacter psychrotolerans]
MNILITAATSASAHKLKNKLQAWEILLGDYADLPDFMVKNMGLLRLPNPASASYQHEMLTLCLDKGIEAIYALTGEELNLLQQSELLFNEYNIALFDGQAYL